MKRLGLVLLLLLGPACTTTARWENQLDRYQSGRLDPHPSRDRIHRVDLRPGEEKRTADFGRTAGDDVTEAAVKSLILLMVIL